MFVDLPAPHGRLEGVFWDLPDPYAAAVVLHPHPQLGGTMHHHAPYRLARALREANIACVRFNFRGVGRSTGAYAEGQGEREDVLSGLAFLEAHHPGTPLWIAGFSFGAWVGLQVAATEPRIRAVLVAGVPVSMFDHAFVAGIHAPIAAIQGTHDAFGPMAALRETLATRGPVRITGLDADHMFSGQLDALEAAAAEAIGWLRSLG